MLYYWYCRDEKEDNRYHVRKCPKIKAAFKKDPPKPFYIHTTIDNIKKLGRIPCSVCKPDDPKHSADFMQKFKPNKSSVS